MDTSTTRMFTASRAIALALIALVVAMAGLMAVVTAILGAVVGANLVLILLDMVRAGSPGDRVTSDTATNARSTDVKLEASTGAGRR
jgi:hypothetical protein